MAKGTIIKILPVRYSRNGDTTFTRVSFRLEDKSFAQTDLCRTYQNFTRWIDHLNIGTELDGLDYYKDPNGKVHKNKIDADSRPVEIEHKDFEIIAEWTRPLEKITPRIYQTKLL